jgi:hypothetical protein
MSSWGTFTPDDPEAPAAPEPTPEAAAPADAPPKEPAKADPEPEPETPPEDDDADFEEMSFDDLDKMIAGAVKTGIAEVRKADAAADPDADPDGGTPPEVKKLADENAALKAQLAEREQKLAETEYKDGLAKLQHSIDSTAGKLKMTDDEIMGTVAYLKADPTLAKTIGQPGGITFEEAAMRRYPGIEGRARSAPPATASDEGKLGSPPAANGAGAPKPFKHDPRTGNYEDVTNHLLRSGEAAKWGKYT